MKPSPKRLLVIEEKHGIRYFHVPTDEMLHAAALKILKGRDREQWYYEPEAPEKPVAALLTQEQVESLPGSQRLVTDAEIARYKRAVREYGRETTHYQTLQRAIATNDGQLALAVLTARRSYEYEGFSFELLEEP